MPGPSWARSRSRESDPEHGAGERDLGRTSDSQRIGHAGHRGGRLRGGEVHTSQTQATFADVARVPGQPPAGPRGDRLLCGATATFRILFGFIVLAHDRRRVVYFNVTAHPTAEWTARQVVQAFPEEAAPRFLLRDRDKVYGERFQQAIDGLGIGEVVTAARSPWQKPLRGAAQRLPSPRWVDSTIATSERRRDERTRERQPLGRVLGNQARFSRMRSRRERNAETRTGKSARRSRSMPRRPSSAAAEFVNSYLQAELWRGTQSGTDACPS